MRSPYASFSRRAFARLIDLAVIVTACGALFIINLALGFPVRYTSLFNLIWPETPTMFMTTDFPGIFVTFVSIKLFFAFPYFTLMESSAGQGTLGKRVTRIKVTTVDGERLSFGRAAGRFFLKIVSATLFMSGYLVSFSDKRQTWHDYMSRTLVLRKEIEPKLYVMPRRPSGWMFDIPCRERSGVTERSTYVCISCEFESNEEHVGCPRCGRPYGYVEPFALRGLGRMIGIVFLILGIFLAYNASWILNERLIDYHLHRDGTPVGIIFIVFLVTVTCLVLGLSALFGHRWPLRLLLVVGVGMARR